MLSSPPQLLLLSPPQRSATKHANSDVEEEEVLEKVLFTGDVAFNQGIGRTDLPGGAGQELKESIKRISLLDVEYLLSGHGDILSGREKVKANFGDIEEMWFPYL